MSYTALYRKYRPDTFDQAKGQDHIITVLKNQIISNRVGHAYLFCGTRGTGKTSIAKVFAKAINCESPIDGNPCNQCALCQKIKAQTSLNVIEIDAASNNGVDNIREIVEEVRYSPTEGHYKVYIIDEVHMLSTGAFNALLKTLEEPPEYVVFLLATTESHKIPVTILSRCQRYDFNRIPTDLITSHLVELTKLEGVLVEEKALRYIARKADGAFRDAISLLDQCISFCFGETLDYDRVLEILGAVDIEIFAKLLRYLSKASVTECIHILDEIILSGRDLTQFISDFIWYLRNLLMVKTAEGAVEILEISTEQTDILEHEAKATDLGMLMHFLEAFSELFDRLRYATQKRVITELVFLRLCCPQTETDVSALEERVRHIEEKLEAGSFVASNGPSPDAFEKAHCDAKDLATKEASLQNREDETTREPEYPKAIGEDLKELLPRWNSIKEKVSPMLRMALISTELTVENESILKISARNEMDFVLLQKEKHLDNIVQTIEKEIGKHVEVKIGLLSDDPKELSQAKKVTSYLLGLNEKLEKKEKT